MEIHTPLPWKANFDDAVTIRDGGNNQLAILTHINTRTGGRRDSDEVNANAKLIVHACNSFAPLVTALKAAKQDIEKRADPCGEPYNMICEALEKACAA